MNANILRWRCIMVLLAFPVIFFSCSTDDEPEDDTEVVDPEVPGFCETMMGNIMFEYDGLTYSLKCGEIKKLNHPSRRPGIQTCDFCPAIAYSLRSCNKDVEVFKDWKVPEKDENFFNEIRPLLEADPSYDPKYYSWDKLYHISENESFRWSSFDYVSYCIDGNAFNDCKKLKEVYLEDYCYAIAGTSAAMFYGCDNLTDIYACSPILVESKKFGVDYDKVTLHVYPGNKEAFKKTYPWKNFKHIVDDFECEYHKQMQSETDKSKTINGQDFYWFLNKYRVF